MLFRNVRWPRTTQLLLALVALGVVVALLHFGSQPEHSFSLPKPGVTTTSSPFEREIPAVPSKCASQKFETLTNEANDRAVALSPAELLCRHIDPKAPGIPRLFHQSWKTTELPAKFQRWSDGCRAQHVGWEWVLWTDDDNLELVKTYFPSLEEAYLGLPGPIYRADFARNLYMYMFGGVYADLDTDCLRPTDEALEPFRVPFVDARNQSFDADPKNHRGIAIFGRLGNDEKFVHSIPNAWMASTARHPFWAVPVQFAIAKVEERRSLLYRFFSMPTAEHITGPIALRQCVLRWKASLKDLWDELILLPPHMVYPYNWKWPGSQGSICSAMYPTLDEDLCKKKLKVKEKGSLSITYWSNTHKGEGINEKTLAEVSHD